MDKGLKEQKVININALENSIIQEIRRYKSHEILVGIKKALKDLNDPKSILHRYLPKGLPFFIAAGIAAFAVRFSNPYKNGKPFDWRALSRLETLVSQYLLSDPITFDKELGEKFKESNPTFLMLRIAASQFAYNINPIICYSHPLILYGEAIKEATRHTIITQFDFHTEFEKLIGTTLENFLKVGFISWAASSANSGFTRGYFEAARKQGIRIPDDKTILTVLNNISATSQKFRETFEKRRVSDRRFRAYDFNPLFSYPLIRPWKGGHLLGMDSDKMIAPVPDLIGYRCSTGIYYQMFNTYSNIFSDWFGYVLEAYIGIILKKSINHQRLISGEIIRKSYSGKVVDWVVIDGNSALIFEVKAIKFSRPALAIASEEDINKSLKQVIKGLKQLKEFRDAILSKKKGLEDLHHCTEVILILISYEKFYLINSVLFKKHVNSLLAQDNINIPFWIILSVDELENLQPYLFFGVGFAETIKNIEKNSFNSVLKDLHTVTGKTTKDSYFYEKNEDFFKKILSDSNISQSNIKSTV